MTISVHDLNMTGNMDYQLQETYTFTGLNNCDICYFKLYNEYIIFKNYRAQNLINLSHFTEVITFSWVCIAEECYN